MAKKSKKQSAKKLLKNLKPAGLVFTGVVRSADDDGDALMFARPGGSKWIKVQSDQIQDIKLVQAAHRSKQSHPLVTIVLKPPQSPEGRVFAGLAQLHRDASILSTANPLCWDSGRKIWVPCPKAPKG